jgi:hypothetical protein
METKSRLRGYETGLMKRGPYSGSPSSRIDRVKTATIDLLREGVRTRDLGGKESTESFTEAVAAEVSRRHGAQPQSQKTNSNKERGPSVADST